MNNINNKFFTDETRDNASKMHKRVWSVVRSAFESWGWRQEEPLKIDGTTLFVDIFCKVPIKIAIEVQGKQHRNYSKFFHTNQTEFKKAVARDVAKKNYLIEDGYAFVEIYTDEKITNEEIAQRILDAIEE